MISIRETLETFNKEQFESFIYFSIYFFSLAFFFFFYVIVPFALNASAGACPSWAFVHFRCFAWVVHISETTVPFKGANQDCISPMHSKGSYILFHPDIHLVFCYMTLILAHTFR